ncbi:MAG: ferrous iron transport protein B, partial [Bacteroidota bacterium]
RIVADKKIKVALAGNPNSGKSTLFNRLTGLSQKIANFPGVTVEKKSGSFEFGGKTFELLDLPGTYSLYPKTPEEWITTAVLCDESDPSFPDLTLIVADSTNIKRSVFFATQVSDLGRPCILVLNMADMLDGRGEEIDVEAASKLLSIPVVLVNAIDGKGLDALKQLMAGTVHPAAAVFNPVPDSAKALVELIRNDLPNLTDYAAFQIIMDPGVKAPVSENTRARIDELRSAVGFSALKIQSSETLSRYEKVAVLVPQIVRKKNAVGSDYRKITSKLDDILIHPITGYLAFLSVMFVMFQAVFAWASPPMELIDSFFAWCGSQAEGALPAGVFRDLLVNGIIAGLGGVVIFIPQIALLFLFITILEDTGYMARVSFMLDKQLRRYGLNGRSVIPMISGVACAVPAILSARTIANRKERLITMFVTPLMSCSARLPVYTLLIALVIPDDRVFGFLNMQGLVLMGLYLIGFLAAILSAWAMKYLMKSQERSFFIMELPVYRLPRWRNVLQVILDKIRVFIFEAGKVIVAISIILWALASYGPGDKFAQIEKQMEAVGASDPNAYTVLASEKLKWSYAGRLGSAIEPVLEPLGFDWKIGIALVTSFAAREVFVGTMSTIYSVDGGEEDVMTIREKMRAEINPSNGKPRYDLPTGIGLMLFYAFALQCMSTLAVMKRETGGWKWPLMQFAYMGFLAYFSALLVHLTMG